MITHFDHVTICVRDVDAAKRFFGLLGFGGCFIPNSTFLLVRDIVG
jgi:hypothetical protein